jgi:hypothetical protein
VIDASIEPHTRWSGPDSIPVEGLDDDDERDLVLQS